MRKTALIRQERHMQEEELKLKKKAQEWQENGNVEI